MSLKVCIPGDAGTYRNYRAAVQKAGGIPCFHTAPEVCDCLLLPGGGDLEPWRYRQANTASRNLEPDRDALEWSLLAHFLSRKKPILGVCRGMQVINVFFGGDLVQDWPGHSAADGADRLHAIKTAPSRLRALYGTHCIVNSSHHQVVGQLGDHLEPLQWADDGAVEPPERHAPAGREQGREPRERAQQRHKAEQHPQELFHNRSAFPF